jgi:septal ring factor EnvC (AmiA/AmiB activator)
VLDNPSSVDDDRRVTDNSTTPARSLDDLRDDLAAAWHARDHWADRVDAITAAIEQAEADERAAQADEVDLDAALVETLSAMQRAKLDAVRDMLVRKADAAREVCTLANKQGLTTMRERARTRYQSYSTALAEFDRLTR